MKINDVSVNAMTTADDSDIIPIARANYPYPASITVAKIRENVIANSPAGQQAEIATEQATIATTQAGIATTQAGIATGAAATASIDAAAAGSARDAALIQAGVYIDTTTGMAAVASGEAFKVQGVGNVAAYEYRKSYSPNLFNTATVRDGYYVSNVNGQIISSAGWGVTDFIPVTAGLQYSVSGTKTQTGCGFFSSASDSAAVAGGYSFSATPFTVTAPAAATHMVLTLYSPTYPAYTDVQVEQAAAPTDYYAYGTEYPQLITTYPSKAYVDTVVSYSAPVASLVLDDGGYSYIQTTIGGDTLKINLLPFVNPTHSEAGVFTFAGESLNNVTHRTAGDDSAPYWVYNTVIGARHGYAKTTCTVSGHGKTLVDVGSVYADGASKEWVIVDIPDINSIAITARADNTEFTSGTLTHVSGGTHTTAFTPSSVEQGQLYPSINNRQFAITVDGAPVTDYTATYQYRDNATFAESYDVLEKNSMIEWLITQAGSSTDITDYEGTAGFTVSQAYVFDAYGGCTTYADFIALQNISAFSFLSFNQAGTMADGVSGAVKYYIPKSVPFTQNSIAYDFTTPYDMTGFAPASYIDFTAARCEATGQLVDRVIQMNDSLGMAVGYLPVQDAAPSVRRTNAADRALNIFNTSRKIYLICVDNSSSFPSLSVGDVFSAVAYRAFFKRTADRTASYVIRSKEGTFLYCDWHITTVDRVTLPPDLHGEPFTLVEKSSNVSVLSASATTSIVFDVTADSSYGYAILQF